MNGALAGLAGWLLLAAGADPPARAGETAAEAPPQTEADEMHRIHTRPSLSNLVDTTGFDFPRRADGVDRRDTGIEIAVDDERLRVDVVREDILRLAISRGGTFEEQPTFATCGATAPVPPFTVRESAGTVTVATAAIELRIAREPFSLDACRPDGSSVFRSLRPAPDHSEAYGRLNNRFVVGRECDPGDAILGLGEKAAPFNRLGRSFVLWNNDIYGEPVEEVRGLPDGAPEKDPRSTGCEPYYMSIPFYCHLSGSRSDQPAAGFFIDNGYRARFDFAGNACRFVFLGGAYAEYVFAGPALRQVLEGYTWLTGRMGLPPLWALGYHQCRWHEYAEDSFLRLANTFRQKHIPCDGLWLDIHYMDGYRVFTWDPRKYPDPPAMLSRLEGLGFRTVTIIDPGVKREAGYPVCDSGLAANAFCKTEGGTLFTADVWPGRTVFPDFATERARNWWAGFVAQHAAAGVSGIWLDMNEPALFTTPNVDASDMRFDRDGANHPHERYHNQYALLMAMATAEGLQKRRPAERPFVLSRAGSAGIQRFAANWMGDNCARWEHLRLSLPMALGLGLSGQPFVGADVGGFNEAGNAELLVRWMQCGAMTPFFRNHTSVGQPDKYPWSFGPEVEELCREAIRLRYRFLPYLYAAFLEAAETGAPIQRPLVFEFQSDRQARDIEDEYLLGKALLVAPVCAPGKTRRSVYLPSGTWVDWHSGKVLEGPRRLTLDAPLQRIPLLLRGGHVLPLLPEAPESTQDLQPERIELHLAVPAGDGEFDSTLYEDDGLTFACRQGSFLRTALRVSRRGPRCTLAGAVTGKGYPEFRRGQFRLVVHGAAPARWRINGADATADGNSVVFRNAAEAFEVELELPRARMPRETEKL